jgi:dihydrofolate reductase
MGRIVVVNHLTLDGVMQAPGRADEDTRDGFRHGGWAAPYADPVMAQTMGEGMARPSALLFGRRTYEDFYSVWPNRTDNPFTPVLNASIKYVASRTLKAPLPWANSVLLEGDVAEAVAHLKAREEDLVILGSGELIRTLLPAGLIDELLLTIHPLVMGQGRRLFPEKGPYLPFRLVESKPTTTGVLIARYQPA